MTKVLRWVGTIFAIIGGVFTAVGMVVMRRGPAFACFAIVGVVFLALGIAFLCFVRRHGRLRARLLADGMRIDAEITGVRMDTRFEFNGRHPLVIDCQALNPEDGRVYVFHSEGIWYDPRPYLDDARAESLPVFVDPNNYKHYAVDTSAVLPEMG